MRKKLGKLLKNKEGTTMTEVLVAFLVIMIVMAMFSHIITVSIDFFKRSRQQIEKTEAFDAKYYKTAEREKRIPIEGGTYTLTLDKEKTSVSNTPPMSLSIALPKGRLNKYTDSAESGFSRYSIEIIRETENEGESE